MHALQIAKQSQVESASSSVLDASVSELLVRLRARTLTSQALVDAHIARTLEVNPRLNALVADRFDAARREAAAADAVYDSADHTELPPLLGIPCSIKEFLALQGMPQTGGVLYRKGVVAETDSVVVSRIRQAGAVPLGVTNVPEGGLWMETHNLIWGRTNNPWDLSRTSGGSSGGEGALVAAGGAPFGIGSDIGGSIRIPAAFCGTVGHKPSAGLIPNTGHFPAAKDSHGYMVIGPLCRRVDDVMPILRVLAGPDGRDPACQKMPLRDPETVKISSLRIFSWPGGGAVKVRPVMREAVDLCAAALRSEGARDRVLSGHDLESGFVLWMSALQAANPDGYEKVVAGEGGIPILRELLLYPLGRSRFVLPTLVTMLSESIVRRLPIGFASFLQRLDRLREELDAQLGEDGVILHPPYSRPAPRHKLALLTPFDAECTALFNVLGYAVTVVPVGFDEEGLPVSIQVISRRGNDHLTLAAARVIERHFGGWRRAMK